ncbi:MAG TPA: lamin tail domain-containing protein, partial [Candidatus Dormibacteraeota bacterium]|nr:lamin tail domain-containing protein [Candidatus Dormibacteraeota bacterium]
GPTTGLFGANDPTVTRLWGHPPFLRAYWRAFEDAVNGPLVAANIEPMLDAKYAAFVANGVGASSPSGIKSYVASRRSYIQSQLATVAAPFAITSNGGNAFSTNNNLLQLTGTAPVGVKTIEINGIAYEPTWTAVTTWVIRLPLAAGANVLSLVGLDLRGNPIPGATDSITVTYTGSSVSPVDNIVINEIMYNPLAPGASFVELYNLHPTVSFNLSNWRLNGADFTFPEGTIITPGGFLVVAKDRDGFINAYGNLIPIVGEMQGNLDNGGENLQLIRPGPPDLVVDEVRYDDDPPWPSAAHGTGPSLQLIDATQDNRIVSNWGAAQAGGGNHPPVSLLTITNFWRFQQGVDLSGVNWTAPSYNDSAWSPGLGLLYVETAALPAPKNTPLTLGSTTYYFRTHFNFSGNPADISLALQFVLDDGAVVYLNGLEIYRIGMPAGPVNATTFANRTVTDAVYEGPFVIPSTGLVQGDNVIAVEAHQAATTSSDIVFGLTLDTTAGTVSGPFTPGAPNSIRSTVPPFPKLWINELQTVNTTGPQDNAGEREPWLELLNSSAGNIVLTNFYLTDSYSNLLKWPFPAGAIINAGQFKTVWADGEPGETSASDWHTSFRLNANTGSVALVEVKAGSARIVDYINYNLIPADKSFGSFPDAQPNRRRLFSIITPGNANNGSFPPIQVFINEIMAANTATIVDPADGKFDDWVELYNAGSTTADLSGYFLTDNLSDKTKFVIPAGKTIPPGGFLLVWADSDPSQNAYSADIHTSFSLALAGEAFGIYDPNTNTIDEISFLQQTNNISLGRCPDGFASPLVFFSSPTPRASNICPGVGNTAPTLDPISNKTIDEGVLLTFSAVGHDADNPSQTLSYSLVSPPPGAAIGASSGVFTWVPAENQ